MEDTSPPPTESSSAAEGSENSSITKQKKKGGCLQWFLVFFGVFGLLVLIAVAIFWWVGFRPIQPVTLSAQEEKVLQQKVEVIKQPTYQKGKKEIILSERELNSLINKYTPYGDRAKLELADDAVHARFKVDVPEDFPVMSGKTVNIRAKMIVIFDKENPRLELQDVTCMGISMPNDWLGNVKNINLLEQVSGESDRSAFLKGIKNVVVKSGEVQIRLNE